tara:strand:- start:52 stop:366 length:315 start_codon:yes stop_codon:yes gene_type:complete
MRKASIFILFLLLACSKDAAVPEEPAPTQYTLTVTVSEGGFVTPDANGTYDTGAVITISATPNEGYKFDRFSGSDNDDSRCAFARYCRTAIKMNSNRDVRVFSS